MQGNLTADQVILMIYIAGFLLSASFHHDVEYSFIKTIFKAVFWPFRLLGF